MMQRTILAMLVATPLLVLAGCAGGPKVQALADPTADFHQYQSFGFVEPLGTDRAGYQSIVSQQLKQAATRELERRGLRHDPEHPQLLVNFYARQDERVRVTRVPEPVGMHWPGPHGYRHGFYAPWPHYRERTEVHRYREGTLTIDVVDAAKKQMVWEGTVAGTMAPGQMARMPAAIDSAVAAAFAKFPPAAGSR